MSSFPNFKYTDDAGFSLVEILVVILIVGILTAIAVPSFLGQTAKAESACAKSTVGTMVKTIKTYQTDHGNYAGASAAALHQIDASITDGSCGSTAAVVVADPAPATPVGGCDSGSSSVSAANATVGFCVAVRTTGGAWFAVTEKNNGLFRTCTVPTGKSVPFGGCLGSGGTNGSW